MAGAKGFEPLTHWLRTSCTAVVLGANDAVLQGGMLRRTYPDMVLHDGVEPSYVVYKTTAAYRLAYGASRPRRYRGEYGRRSENRTQHFHCIRVAY